jgi:hypothetical protein
LDTTQLLNVKDTDVYFVAKICDALIKSAEKGFIIYNGRDFELSDVSKKYLAFMSHVVVIENPNSEEYYSMIKSIKIDDGRELKLLKEETKAQPVAQKPVTK